MSDELKPCPFCGVEIEAVERRGRAGLIYWCPKCACSQTKLEKWQSRPLEDAIRKQLEEEKQFSKFGAEKYNILRAKLDIALDALNAQLIFKNSNPFISQGDFDHLYEIAEKALAEIGRIGAEK